MKYLFLIFLLSISVFQSANCQESTLKKINLKFLDSNDSPIENLVVQIDYPGGVAHLYHMTNKEGEITINLVMHTLRKENSKIDTIYAFNVTVNDDGYETFFKNLEKSSGDLLKNDIEIFKLNTIYPAALTKTYFNDLVGIFSLEDINKKDTLVLYEFEKINTQAGTHLMSLIRFSKNKYRLLFYSNSFNSGEISEREEFVKIKLKKDKLTIRINGYNHEFCLNTLKGNSEYRYILVRK
jgi:hypothetical protein